MYNILLNYIINNSILYIYIISDVMVDYNMKSNTDFEATEDDRYFYKITL